MSTWFAGMIREVTNYHSKQMDDVGNHAVIQCVGHKVLSPMVDENRAWVHTVCHRGFLNISTDEKADDFCWDWRIKS